MMATRKWRWRIYCHNPLIRAKMANNWPPENTNEPCFMEWMVPGRSELLATTQQNVAS